MRRLLPLLLLFALASSAAAQDQATRIRQLRRLLISKNVDERLDAVQILSTIDARASIRTLEEAVKRSVSDMEKLAKPFDKLDVEWHEAGVGVRTAREKGDDISRRLWEAELQRVDTKWNALNRQLKTHLRLVLAVEKAFKKFNSPDAVDVLLEGARRESNPLLRQIYITALGRPALTRAVPMLMELLDRNDGRIRAHAVRALEPYLAMPGVLDRVLLLADDKQWPVRLGAYQVIVNAPLKVAVPFFVKAAREERGEMAQAVDSYLEALTGQSFRGRTSAWGQWWDENRRAFMLDTYRRVEKAHLPEGSKTRTTFFQVPIESQKLVFCIDLSFSMEAEMSLDDPVTNQLLEQHQLGRTRHGYAKAELIRALRELPDGAYFNIVAFSDSARKLSGRMLKLNVSTRRRAIRWIMRQKLGQLTNIWGALHAAFNNFHSLATGASAFKDLPDTIVFLTDGTPTRGRFQQRRSLTQLVGLWNRSLDIVIHCVGMGRGHDSILLEALALQNGGYYVDLTRGRRVPDRRTRPVPVAVRALSYEYRVEQARLALRKGTRQKRLWAARELRDCGRAARKAIPDLIRVLGDPEADVREAVAMTLAGFGKPSVEPLIGALRQKDNEAVITASKTLGKLGPDATAAVPALTKLLTDKVPLVAAAAARALGDIGASAGKALPMLVAAMDSENEDLKDAATAAVKKIVKESADD